MLLSSAVRRYLFNWSHPRPFYGDDESEVLQDANYLNRPIGADGEQATSKRAFAQVLIPTHAARYFLYGERFIVLWTCASAARC